MLVNINYDNLSEEAKLLFAKETKNKRLLKKLSTETDFDIRYAVYTNPHTSKKLCEEMEKVDYWLKVAAKGFIVSRMNGIVEIDMSG